MGLGQEGDFPRQGLSGKIMDVAATEADRTADDGNHAVHGLEKGTLAAAVGADDGGHFAAVDVKIHVLQNAVGSDFHGHILYPKAAGMAAGTAVM